MSGKVDDLDGKSLLRIAALPPTTVRQLGSHQLITDPSSVVKELIDNALDARAKSIFVDIGTNTIDSIQVKDDGHGIPREDRALACRRYCTSKIRDFRDLKGVGGKWLGFRGEALASIADMSDTVTITTRVEGEPVAVKLTYQRNGELTATERGSHPVGTTVKVTKLLESAKVRKDLAVKGSAKCLAKIRRLMQAYALARPAVRLRLHVLKAKPNICDFIYAPKTDANVEDAALKVIGKECALQCDWTGLELNGFELHAFLPKAVAVGSKVAYQGAYISVDSRPVSASRGTFKKIAVAVGERLRKANSTLKEVKTPFFTMDIICPEDSYDPNIEPWKDDVIFGDEEPVLAAVDRLLSSHYPKDTSSVDAVAESNTEDEGSTHHCPKSDVQEQLGSSISIQQDGLVQVSVFPVPTNNQQPHWRHSMYGIDEEDLDFLANSPRTTVEEEEACQDVAISNPWTIARMNAPVKPKNAVNDGQLPSPAKSQGLQSPSPVATPPRPRIIEPVTPQITVQRRSRDMEIGDATQPDIYNTRQHPISSGMTPLVQRSQMSTDHAPVQSVSERPYSDFNPPRPRARLPNASHASTMTPSRISDSLQLRRSKPFMSPIPQLNDTWFGQPMHNAPHDSRLQKRPRGDLRHSYSDYATARGQRSPAIPAAKRLVEARMASRNDSDICASFGHTRYGPVDQPQNITDQPPQNARQTNPMQIPLDTPRSTGSGQHSRDTAREMDAMFRFHEADSPVHSPGHLTKSLASNNMSKDRPMSSLHSHQTGDSGVHRTGSSTLPLNFTPPGSHTHNLTLVLSTDTSFLVRQARKLDMTANSLEWGYDSTSAFDAFGSAISERRIMNWVVKVDGMLHGLYERVDGVEVRGALREGIQRFIDLRKGEDEADHARVIVGVSTRGAIIHEDEATANTESESKLPTYDTARVGTNSTQSTDETDDKIHTATKVESPTPSTAFRFDDPREDFDFEQFVNSASGVGQQVSPTMSVKAKDELEIDVGEEMLMGL